MRWLVTGANGFVGQALCAELRARGHEVRCAVRDAKGEFIAVGQIDGHTDWSLALEGIDVVVHLAARVHVMRDEASNSLEEFRRVNLQGTENLAHQAAKAGVKRFVYASSIKVNGEMTLSSPFSENDAANPQEPYGISKWEAEQALFCISKETLMEVAVVRPSLVYGKGVKGNFAQMVKVLEKGMPLPLASVNNRRSLIYVKNLVDALILCGMHPAASNKIYLVSDGESVSTPDLLRKIGAAINRPARLFPFPKTLLKFAGRLLGKSGEINRLLSSLEIDSTKIRSELGWKPRYGLQEGLADMAQKSRP